MLIRLECTLNAEAKYQFLIQTVLNSGNKPTTRFCFVPLVCIMGMGIGSRLRFSVLKYGFDANEL